jgi:hypothetical protein
MADWDADAASYTADLAARRGAGPPATLGEVWNANWKASGLDTLTGSGQPLADAFNNLVDAATQKLGPLPQAARDAGLDYFGAPGFDGKAALLGQLVTKLPKEQQAALSPLLDIRSRAADAAAKTESDAADVAGRTYGLSGLATSWLSSVARQVIDPANVALLAAGGPEGAGVSAIARQALIAGAGQLIQEPVIQNNRAELGLESGVGRAIEDVGQVAGGAVALPLLFRAAGWAARRALSAAGSGDFQAAALLADRDRVVAPADARQLETTAAAVESGRTPVPTPAEQQATHPAIALTGRPEVDAVLNEPSIREAILNPKINDKNSVPYIAGASEGADMTTNVDEHMPRQVDISGVRFDPAEPANIHEQVEKYVMEQMIAAKKTEVGRELTPDEINEIYERAHHEFAEPAEDAWYRARGIDVDEVNAWWAEQDKVTESEHPKNPPPDLYKKPYPHNQVEGSARPEPAAADEWPTQARPLSRRTMGLEQKAPAEPELGEAKPGEQKEQTTTLGNAQLAADAARTLTDAGGDFQIELGEGTEARRVSARRALDEADEDAAAARELNDCLGGVVQEAAE